MNIRTMHPTVVSCRTKLQLILESGDSRSLLQNRMKLGLQVALQSDPKSTTKSPQMTMMTETTKGLLKSRMAMTVTPSQS